MRPTGNSMPNWDLLQGRDAIRQRRQILFRSQLPEVNGNTRGRLSWRLLLSLQSTAIAPYSPPMLSQAYRRQPHPPAQHGAGGFFSESHARPDAGGQRRAPRSSLLAIFPVWLLIQHGDTLRSNEGFSGSGSAFGFPANSASTTCARSTWRATGARVAPMDDKVKSGHRGAGLI